MTQVAYCHNTMCCGLLSFISKYGLIIRWSLVQVHPAPLLQCKVLKAKIWEPKNKPQKSNATILLQSPTTTPLK